MLPIDKLAYYKTKEWKLKADECKQLAGNTCSMCSSTDNLHAHHLTYDRLGAELQSDLQCLCVDCHEKVHDMVTGTLQNKCRVNKRGVSMFKKNDYLTMQEDTVRSLLDLKLWNFLVSSYKQSGVCMHNLKPVTIRLLTEEFTVTRQKVSAFIKRGIEANFIRKQGTSLTLNPYVLVPFGISDDGLHELQSAWTNSNLTKDNQ